jgi:CRP/FNR family transcriptional regulator, cyclic AMP receptor protein
MNKEAATVFATGNSPTVAAEPLARQIAGHPFFNGMSAEYLEILADYAMPATFQKDELIFREGDPANRFYLILEGEVALESYVKDWGTTLVQTLSAGDVLGWSWLFPPFYWHFDARALRPTKAIFLYGTRLRERCEQDHDFGYDLMKRTTEVVIRRLQKTRQHLLAVYGAPV